MKWRWPWEVEETMEAITSDPQLTELYKDRDKTQAAILRAQRAMRVLDLRAELIRDGRVSKVEDQLAEHIAEDHETT